MSQDDQEITRTRMSRIFNEWARRYAAAPDEFTDILDHRGQPFDDYGDEAAATFQKIANEMDAAGLLPQAAIES